MPLRGPEQRLAGAAVNLETTDLAQMTVDSLADEDVFLHVLKICLRERDAKKEKP